jgi:hypothetical protein
MLPYMDWEDGMLVWGGFVYIWGVWMVETVVWVGLELG